MNRCLLILALFLSVLSCRKSKPQSASKVITSFVFKAVLNTGLLTKDVAGSIVNDSIILAVPEHVPLVNVTPTITHTGQSVTPNSNVARDFSNPVRYTVTAADGSKRTYLAVVRVLSSAKEIISFGFKVSDNQGVLESDVDGIVDGDTIKVTVNAFSISNLLPAITYNGASITPSTTWRSNFINAVEYTVTAEDGSTRKYTVIIRSSVSLFIAGQDRYLYAFDAATGKPKWKYALNGGGLTGPTYANGTVFIGDVYHLLALDAATGKLKWQTLLPGGAGTSPQVVNNIVYIGADALVGTTGGDLVAIDASSGMIRWKQKVIGDFIDCDPTVAEGRVVTAGFGGDLLCFDAASGARLWNFDAGIIRNNPVIADGVVFIGSEFYKMLAVDLSSGLKKWGIQANISNPGSHGIGSSPTIHNGTLYNGGGSLYAYDMATGALKWEYPLFNTAITNPVGENGVLFGTHLDNVYAINSNGSLKWRIGTVASTNIPIEPSSATVAHGVLFTGSGYNNRIVALSAASGETIWSHEGSAPFTSGPCIVDGNGKSFHSAVSGAQQ
jgi:eukaryotic-like serine/threonine-protein kinase